MIRKSKICITNIQVHVLVCTDLEKRGRSDCGCLLRTSAGSVDSLIGNIRALIRNLGRVSEWNPMLGNGNPAAATEVNH